MSVSTRLKALCAIGVWGLVLSLSLSSCSLTNEKVALKKTESTAAFCVPPRFVMFAYPDYASTERDQMLLVNVSRLLDTKAVTKRERAEVFYELGIIYDRLGMEATARSMFMNALAENRRYAAPYNFVGIYFAEDGRFQEALDAFDSGLELDPSDAYVNFNRGIVLYLAGRAATALPDFRRFYRADPSDPYRLLWLYLCERSLGDDEQALKNLSLRRDHASDKEKTENWGFRIVSLYLKEKRLDDFFEELKKSEKNPDEFADRLCEGYFYVGMQSLLNGNEKEAYDYMSLSVATRRYAFLEYRYALRLMKNLGQKRGLFVSPEMTL